MFDSRILCKEAFDAVGVAEHHCPIQHYLFSGCQQACKLSLPGRTYYDNMSTQSEKAVLDLYRRIMRKDKCNHQVCDQSMASWKMVA